MTSKKHLPWHRKLAKWAAENPITYCEVRFEGCWGTYGLAPAHSKDRDEIHTEADFNECVAACGFCHTRLDTKMPKDERLRIVKEVIANRDECQAA